MLRLIWSCTVRIRDIKSGKIRVDLLLVLFEQHLAKKGLRTYADSVALRSASASLANLRIMYLSDQTARMCRLIWSYIDSICAKTLFFPHDSGSFVIMLYADSRSPLLSQEFLIAFPWLIKFCMH